MRFARFALTAAMLAVAGIGTSALSQEQAPVQAPRAKGSADDRAAATLAQLTLDEKLTLLEGYFGTDFPPANFTAPEEARYGSAGYVPGIPRLGIPAQWQADAGLGVATQGGAKEKRARTALPSGLATASTWDPALAHAAGAMIGAEARADGFNVLLGGSVNLMREPRNGRNFEYAGEDPWLAGVMVGAQIAGVQSNRIISTVKHFAVNDQETNRNDGNAILEEGALRTSDLLAFQIAIERGDPGAVMCSYNRVGGIHACENPFLLTQVLRDDWGYSGYVLSDWGAVHSTAAAANAGLDQESGFGLQQARWFGADKLRAALASGEITQQRVDLMVTRVLRSMYAHGLIDDPVTEGQAIDFEAHRAVSRQTAEAGIVLLKNDGSILPLAKEARQIAVIGGYADRAVLSGGGSSQVYPEGTNAVPGIEPQSWPGPVVYYPSSPLHSLQQQIPGAYITYVEGFDHEEAVREAASADIAIVFATQWASESIDVSLTLPDAQNELIESVALANPNTVVVLETGGPVLMPWSEKVKGILAAWYPGTAGGEAIANVLTGKVNPSGHLPATFPRSLDHLPHPGQPRTGDLFYDEGAAVGYKWFDKQGHDPLFPFGHGLSYTSFRIGHLAALREGDALVAMAEVTNTGDRAGAEVVQVYLSGKGWEGPRRLGGFQKVELAPGETKRVEIHVDPRLLATWFGGRPGWTHPAGIYEVSVGHSSRDIAETVTIELPPSYLPPGWRP
ncbi:MAG TPA: glycoside hydrolase family 3 C-terminal domain-containing protein [Croceibacterium sp.]|nr:glycoside hydrolase family 3 C-terminal domain-containing protein [Croceibacterium sp.]